MRRDDRNPVTHAQTQGAREARADHDRVVGREFGKRSVAQVVGDDSAPRQVRRPHTADDGAAGDAARGDHHLTLDDRRDRDDTGNQPRLSRERVEISQDTDSPVNIQMPVQAQDPVQKLLAEAVHDRHDDDQRGDPERDPEKREPSDDGDQAFAAARPQIAHRHHPFECGDHDGEKLSRRRG